MKRDLNKPFATDFFLTLSLSAAIAKGVLILALCAVACSAQLTRFKRMSTRLGHIQSHLSMADAAAGPGSFKLSYLPVRARGENIRM